MRLTATVGVGVALAASAAASAAVTGLQVEYDGLVSGRHVWSVYVVSNDVNHVLLNVISHTVSVGSMDGVQHNDLLGAPGTWSPTLTVIPSHLANDSYVTISGLAGSLSNTNLDPNFGAGLGSSIPGGVGWYVANPGDPILFTSGRVKIIQVATNLAEPLSYTARVSIGYKANLPSTTPLYAMNLTYQIVANIDSDGDGSIDSVDCAPLNGDVYPGAPELCATVGTDNDCDGNTSEVDANASDTAQYYSDADNDAFTLATGARFCAGTTNPGFRRQPSSPLDCNDNSAAIYPGAPELCATAGTDNDCDGSTTDVDASAPDRVPYFRDQDNDNFTLSTGALFCAGTTNPGFRPQPSSPLDCNDTSAAIYPGAPEVCATLGTDNDCDGSTDDVDANAADRVPYFRDEDNDSFTLSTGAFFCPGTNNPGFRPQPSSPFDCNDTSAAIYPGAPELCATAGVDNDCDTDASEIDANASDRVPYFRDQDNDTFTLSTGALFCPGTNNPGFRPQPSLLFDCNDASAAVYPGAPETCATVGTDNDCDGDTGEVDANAADRVPYFRDQDNDTFTLSTGALFCPGTSNPGFRSQASSPLDCDDTTAAVYPGAPELCANVGTDNDCDGSLTDIDANATDRVAYFTDADNDTFTLSTGALFCPGTSNPGFRPQPSSPFDCDDTSAAVYPGAPELCADIGTDNDCDSSPTDVDANAPDLVQYFRDADGDTFTLSTGALFCPGTINSGFMAQESPQLDCDDASTAVYPGAPELCANVGTDNDCDGDTEEASDPTTWYSDFDNDGYGDDESATTSCKAPDSSWIPWPGDSCPDDADKLVPGACGCGVADTDTDTDSIADCNDNCPEDPNPNQTDCDADGYGDACAGEPDCNENGQPDSCDVSGGQDTDTDGDGTPDSCQDDCNNNGLPDSYEIAQGLSEDCDDDGLPNECEDGYSVGDTGNMGPVGSGQPVQGVLLGQTAASTEVMVRVEVRGDLDGTTEFLTLTLNDVTVGGDLFRVNASDCPSKPDAAEIAVPLSQWSQIMSASTTIGEVRVRLVASAAVSASQCTSGTTRVTVLYGGPGFDCDGDGQPDSCQLAAGDGDCDGNSVFDACETGGPGDTDSDGRPDVCERDYGDLNLDGRIDGVDLAFLLASWGNGSSTLGDIDGDGDVDGTDLAFLLARWGLVL
jgi:hypothetical protein